jgi:hypothetical protein
MSQVSTPSRVRLTLGAPLKQDRLNIVVHANERHAGDHLEVAGEV